MKLSVVLMAFTGLLLTGCAIPPELIEPTDVPLYVASYVAPHVRDHGKGLKCRLNLVNCVPSAYVGERDGGKVEMSQVWPVRTIVQSEFENVVKSNFSLIEGSEQPNIELKIETRKVLLNLDGKRLKFDYQAAIKILNPVHEDKPYFSKIYSAKTSGVSADRIFVPNCVYEGIQSTLVQFLDDLDQDRSLLAALKDLAK